MLHTAWVQLCCVWGELVWYLVVVAGTKEDAAAGGVPLDEPHPSAVAVQLQHRLRHVAPQTTLWDFPYSHLQHAHRKHKRLHSTRTNRPPGVLLQQVNIRFNVMFS